MATAEGPLEYRESRASAKSWRGDQSEVVKKTDKFIRDIVRR